MIFTHLSFFNGMTYTFSGLHLGRTFGGTTESHRLDIHLLLANFERSNLSPKSSISLPGFLTFWGLLGMQENVVPVRLWWYIRLSLWLYACMHVQTGPTLPNSERPSIQLAHRLV